MGIIDSAIDAFRFKDTIFYKEDSDLVKSALNTMHQNGTYPEHLWNGAKKKIKNL
jgi:hypothetical protein